VPVLLAAEAAEDTQRWFLAISEVSSAAVDETSDSRPPPLVLPDDVLSRPAAQPALALAPAASS